MTKRRRIMTGVLLVCYLVLLSWMLFYSEQMGRAPDASQPYGINLIPLNEIRRFWLYRDTLGRKAVVVNLLGNVAAFTPLGFLVPLTFPRMRRCSRVLLAGFLFSLFAESVQLAKKVGCFDVDDMMLNTLGTLFGYLLFVLCGRIRRHSRGEKI